MNVSPSTIPGLSKAKRSKYTGKMKDGDITE